MIDRKTLLADLQKQVKALEKDLKGQVETAFEIVGPGPGGAGRAVRAGRPGGAEGGPRNDGAGASGTGGAARQVRDRLRAEYDLAFRIGRTAATWAAWRDERVTQAAAAWVLGTVFVRFCEDNGLLTAPYLAGPSHERMVLAEEAQEEFFRLNPAETDRGWLLAAFAEIAGSQAGALLFDRAHNPLYQIPISHDAAKELIAFWRRRGEDGVLVHDFVSDDWDTRFLGDLYQDLSEAARKTYALLQTPDFVEEFILDYTLTPAIAEFGHDEVRMIDPTCGSGHFVLGAFHRLLNEWVRLAPMLDKREMVRRALKAVHGVDLNPFAIAVARFRLFIAALKASEFTTLDEAKNYEFPLNLAIGDSLIKSRQLAIPGMESEAAVLRGASDQGKLFAAPNEQGDLFERTYEDEVAAGEAVAGVPRDELAEFAYATEDVYEFPGILRPGSYHVVVGNPPYITVKDKKLNNLYRELYNTCAGQYALSVPFIQRFFGLASIASNDGRGAGYIGQITANSFMKREFGKKLIEEFFAHRVELTHIIDTSAAYIPGHGTPTVILIGRNKSRMRQEKIRMALSIRGEPEQPQDALKGHVWQAILAQIDRPDSESKWLSVTNKPAREMASYPWSLTGGGAAELKATIESGKRTRLAENISAAGFMATTREDDAYFISRGMARRFEFEANEVVPASGGTAVRDWGIDPDTETVFPYVADGSTACASPAVIRHLWHYRRLLTSRRALSGTQEERGLTWYEYSDFHPSRWAAQWKLSFAFVASHNQFAIAPKGHLLIRSAPMITLKAGASENDHLELLATLNTSVACFWLKEVSQDKGNRGGERGTGRYAWENFFEFTGTKIREFPLPKHPPLELGQQLYALAKIIAEVAPANIVAKSIPTREKMAVARGRWHSARAQMIALQEELDWHVYSLYGLLDEDLTAPPEAVPPLNLGERAFEIVMANNPEIDESDDQWFARHRREGSRKVKELPSHWSDEYQQIVERRVLLINSDRNIGLMERPEYKRRWALIKDVKPWGWAEQEAAALRSWLLDRCEAKELWFHYLDGMEQPRMLSTAQLADLLRPDEDFVSVAELYAPGKDLEKVIAELVADEHVPYLAQLRYKDSGLSRRLDWEDVWDRQRREDAAQALADAAREAAERQREIADDLEDGEERRRAYDEWATLNAEQVKAEAEVKRIRDAIPVPPKYGSGDFLKTSYWRNRGKLDVPKERFVSYPHAGRDGDPALLLGWAGWDHREQAQALATLIVDREQSHGWSADRLAPLLAGLREVLPWVRQWHDEFDYVYGDSPANIYEGFLVQTRDRLHLGDDDLTAWRPPKTTRARKQS